MNMNEPFKPVFRMSSYTSVPYQVAIMFHQWRLCSKDVQELYLWQYFDVLHPQINPSCRRILQHRAANVVAD